MTPSTGEPGYRLKLRRAAEHLDLIDRKVGEFLEESFPPIVGFDLQPEDEWTIIRRGRIGVLDPMFGTYLGDFIHNVRSALDNLVSAMIIRNDASRSVRHAWFPAYEGERQWLHEIVNRDRATDGPAPTDGVSDSVLAAIERSQPYHTRGRAARRRAALLLLQAASNVDKHRTIYATSAKVAPRTVYRGSLKLTPHGYFTVRKTRIAAPGTEIETGSEIGAIKIRQIKPLPANVEVGVHALVPMDLTFSIEGGLDLTQRDIWPMMNEAWKVILRVEKAAGISGFPPPLPDWVWEPEA